jgi:DNA-binding NarL/FixJ family response regulator
VPAPAQTLAALIVDDHPLFVDALALALQPLVGRGQVSSAGCLAEACRILADRRVELVLLDLMLPDAGGVEGVARVRELAVGARLAVVSARTDPVTIGLVRAVGADGFIAKSNPLAIIQSQLREVLAGGAVFPQQPPATGVAARLAQLTPAQARVLAAAATGRLNKQIAADMTLSETTVKTHMSAILKRLGVHNRTQAILALSEASPLAH